MVGEHNECEVFRLRSKPIHQGWELLIQPSHKGHLPSQALVVHNAVAGDVQEVQVCLVVLHGLQQSLDSQGDNVIRGGVLQVYCLLALQRDHATIANLFQFPTDLAGGEAQVWNELFSQRRSHEICQFRHSLNRGDCPGFPVEIRLFQVEVALGDPVERHLAQHRQLIEAASRLHRHFGRLGDRGHSANQVANDGAAFKSNGDVRQPQLANERVEETQVVEPDDD